MTTIDLSEDGLARIEATARNQYPDPVELEPRVVLALLAALRDARGMYKEARDDGERDALALASEVARGDCLHRELFALRSHLESVEHIRGEERAAWMAECERLRAAMPSETVLDALIAMPGSDITTSIEVDEWIERVEAARKAIRAEAGDE